MNKYGAIVAHAICSSTGIKMSVSLCSHITLVPTDSFPHGGDVVVCVFDINQPSLPTLFHSILVSVSVFMALSNVFHLCILPTTRPFLTLFFPSYFCLIGNFNYIYLYDLLVS